MANKNELNAVVSNIIQVSPTMKIFRVSPVGWDLKEFISGQFIALFLPASAQRCEEATEEMETYDDPNKIIKRVYSIASSSKQKEYIEFYITLVRSGALTPRLFNLKIGDKIGLGTRMVGMFTLEQVKPEQNVVLIATGTGVAPYVSMLRADALKGSRKIAVIHGAANSWDLGYSSELTLLESMFDNFVYHPTITMPDNEATSWNGDTRYIQDIWKSKEIDDKFGFEVTPENTDIFLCGNPNMVKSMVEELGKKGFIEHKRKQPGQIHIEEW